MGETKDQWKAIVTADDLDAHMADIGQAQANADILKKMFLKSSFSKGSVYVPGSGTGQIFELIGFKELQGFEFLFCDIKQAFISKLENRLSNHLKFRTAIDDVEESLISEKFDAAVVVLLLEHVNWQIALENILKTGPKRLFLIIQVQNSGKNTQMVATQRELRPTIKQFIEKARPALVNVNTLDKFLVIKGYEKVFENAQEVPDNKKMFGIYYQLL